MGEIFLAEDPMLARRLAIKVLPSEFALDPERRSRLLHEARAASALNHPNIITVHDLGEAEGSLFVAVELIDGDTLREWGSSALRTPAEILRIGRQAAQALAFAHAAGLVHRDLKPENLMVRRDGLLKILDFGLARSVSPGAIAQTATLPGTVMGTAPYMSPEQVLGQPAGPASDVFSLGTILYELLTGKHPFALDSPVETMHRILHETPENPSRLNPVLHADFDFVLGKALSKDPRRRHSSMSDLDVDLETLECGCGASAPAADKDGTDAPRTIAVLPFKNIGGAPELSYLGTGLADAVITQLSYSPDLIVRTTSSILPYENKPVDPRRIGQELDASAVLDASFQRAGERFRATARLVESSTGRPLWAGKVDVRFDDIFEVQDQVAHGIAEALTARLTVPAAARTAGAARPPNPAAYMHLMRGNEGTRRATREGMQFAISEFGAATREAPHFAPAWGSLAFAYLGMVDGGFSPDPSWHDKAEEAIGRALALDPNDGQVRLASGGLNLVRGRKREAYRDLCASAALTPNNALSVHYLTYLYRLCDMMEEARAANERALELDPYLPWLYGMRVRIELFAGKTEEARSWLERERQKCGNARVDQMEGVILALEGRFTEAAQWLERRREDDTEYTGLRPLTALFYHLAGREGESRDLFKNFRAFAEIDMDHAADSAAYLGHVGEMNEAFRMLDRAAALGNDSLTLYEGSPFFESLRSDPRWKPFIEGVRGRVAQWKREFQWPPPARPA